MKKNCKCIETVDKLLERQGDRLVVSFSLKAEDERVVVATERDTSPGRPRKKGSSHLVATYCPFCGKKYVGK